MIDFTFIFLLLLYLIIELLIELFLFSYSENSVSSPAQQSDPDKSLSLGDVGLRISLADTFHDEMVAWYQNQDTVKKATLV